MSNTYSLFDCDRNGTERELIFHYEVMDTGNVYVNKVSLKFNGMFRNNITRCISKKDIETVEQTLTEREEGRGFDAWCDKVDDSKYANI